MLREALAVLQSMPMVLHAGEHFLNVPFKMPFVKLPFGDGAAHDIFVHGGLRRVLPRQSDWLRTCEARAIAT